MLKNPKSTHVKSLSLAWCLCTPFLRWCPEGDDSGGGTAASLFCASPPSVALLPGLELFILPASPSFFDFSLLDGRNSDILSSVMASRQIQQDCFPDIIVIVVLHG